MEDDLDLFATMSFKGERFNGKFIPVDVLPAIASYQDTLIQMAKAIWHEENPEKIRTPKNFSRSFELGLRGIGQGSKVAQLPRRTEMDGQLFGDSTFDDIFFEAQERLANSVLAANNNSGFRPLPENVIAPFERMGKSISISEFIDIDPLAHGKKRAGIFRLSDKSVSLVIERSRIRKKKRIDNFGFIVGISEAPPILKISSSSGVFSYPLAWEELRSNPSLSIGTVVSFSIDVETDAFGEIKQFIAPVALSPAANLPDGKRLASRIESFGTLRNGWLDGVGNPPSKETRLRGVDLSCYLSRQLQGIAVFPEVEGGIQFEWISNGISASLLINSENFLLGASDLKSDKFREKNFKGLSFALLRELGNLDSFVGRAMD